MSNSQIRTMVTCTTKAAENVIKDASRTTYEDLYHKNVVMNLIAKEFGYHSICYKNFTKPALTLNTSNSNENLNEKASNFGKVVEFISASILNGQQGVSIKTLTELNNKEQAQDQHYRHKLKDVVGLIIKILDVNCLIIMPLTKSLEVNVPVPFTHVGLLMFLANKKLQIHFDEKLVSYCTSLQKLRLSSTCLFHFH